MLLYRLQDTQGSVHKQKGTGFPTGVPMSQCSETALSTLILCTTQFDASTF